MSKLIKSQIKETGSQPSTFFLPLDCSLVRKLEKYFIFKMKQAKETMTMYMLRSILSFQFQF